MDLSCPSCGASNPATGRFCRECGAALAASCPSCGAAVEVGQKFCGDCGTPLAANAAPIAAAVRPVAEAPTSAPVTERRVCSVLFCDLVGFTPLSQSRDAEEVRELLSRYFDMARTVIGRYGGVVEKFIGDAVMAVWGTPVAVEGDTERAVRAALELVAAVAALGREVGAPSLAARAGVVTGEVAVTVGATNEGMVAGDAVNTASRVQSVASPGTVFVDAATQRLAQAGVDFTDAGEFELKGKTEAQRLWRAGRVLSNVGGAQRVDGLEAPITGRDLELRLIKDLFHAAADRRQPRLVAVTGPAGVGKSRLGWEFEKYIDGLSATVWWHRGRCLSYGEGVSFWALAEIVRQRMAIAEEDPVEVAAGKLAAGLDRYVTLAEERDYIGVRLARLLGLPHAADTGQELAREELFAGWRLWFERLAAESPVTLLIEDLQYADEGLLDFLDHLLDWARDAPIFVLTFSRPEMRVENRAWGTGRNRTPMALDPLDATSMLTLLDELVPDLPPAAATAIADQAQGIPLFAVETIRALIDRDIVIPVDGVYRLVGELGTLTVPDSLHGLLAARLDALSVEVRSLVADASVLGSSFPAEALAAVSGSSVDQVQATTAELVRRGVFEILADPLSPQRGTYRFAHEMLRQVAYETLSRHDRKSRHLAVADHLRNTFANDGEEVVDVIARHYLDALHAVPDAPDAATTRERAIEVLIRAGDRASRTGARGRAATQYAHAAELVDATDDAEAGLRAGELWERASQAALDDANSDAAVAHADHANEKYLQIGLPRAAARTQILAGIAFRRRGMHAEARYRLDAALGVLSDDPDADTVRALNQLGSVEVFSGNLERGAKLANEALGLGQALDVGSDTLAGLFLSSGIAAGRVNRMAEAAAYLREAARLGELAGAGTPHGMALLNLADTLNIRDPAAAVEVAREAVTVLSRVGNRYGLSGAIENQVLALLCTGDWDAADEVLAGAVNDYGLALSELQGASHAWLPALRGDVDLARSRLEEVPDLATSEDPQDRAAWILVHALIEFAESRPAEALALATQALEFLPVLGPGTDTMRWGWPLASRCAYELNDSAEVQRLLALLDDYRPGEVPAMLHAERDLTRARLAAGNGDPGADEQFAAAIAGMRSRSAPFHLAHGLLDHAEHLAASGRRQEAAALVEEAGSIGARLRAHRLVERAAKAAATTDVRSSMLP
jgi:class 3 adenylate cyclase/tetratricopeptide (TPR) repeat protein